MSAATSSSQAAVLDYTLEQPLLDLPPIARTRSRASSETGLWLPTLLFFTTVFTTGMMGARFMENFQNGLPPLAVGDELFPIRWMLNNPAKIVEGIPFAVTLLSILLAHELGHYFAARRHGVSASLPHFLPAPTLSGTAGAVIRLRSSVPSRTALLDIGASGPLLGFIVALPFAVVGLLLSRPDPGLGEPLVGFNAPPLFQLLNSVVQQYQPSAPALNHLLPHPVLLAAWIGMFVTFLNLLPAGQLDGGHILYASAPRAHKAISQITVVCLLFAGVYLWVGWLLWAILLMMPFLRHPRVTTEPQVPFHGWTLTIIAIALFALTLMPAPFTHSSLLDFFH
jgi:Zn-dependent protease